MNAATRYALSAAAAVATALTLWLQPGEAAGLISDDPGASQIENGLVFEGFATTLTHSGSGSSTEFFPGTHLIFTDLSVYIPYALLMGSAKSSDVGAMDLAITAPVNGLDIALDFAGKEVAPVPLPGTLIFLGTALFGLGMVGRRMT